MAFSPSTKSAANVLSTYLRGDLVTQKLTSNSTSVVFYQLQPHPNNANALIFRRVDNGTMQDAATPWLQVTTSASIPAIDHYWLSASQIPTAITETADEALPVPSYSVDGRAISENQPHKGIVVRQGRKILKR